MASAATAIVEDAPARYPQLKRRKTSSTTTTAPNPETSSRPISQGVMASSTTGADCDKLTDFSDLKKWIAMQEAHQTAFQRPAPLTEAERHAIAELAKAAKAAQKPVEEPVMDDKNWVGLLQRYRDAHRDDVGISYTEEACICPKNPPNQRWIIGVEISEAPGMRFPSPGFGARPDGALPSFIKKKDGKQYAAKHAVEWLRNKELMPPDGEDVTFKKLKAQPAVTSPPNPSTSAPGPAHPSALASNQNPPPTNHEPSAPNNNNNSNRTVREAAMAVLDESYKRSRLDSHDGEPDAKTGKSETTAGNKTPPDTGSTTLVGRMCQRLNLPQPKYVLEHIDNTQSMFRGHAEFGDSMHLPPILGAVENIFGRKYAKEKIAENVLEYLLEVEAKRKAKRDRIMSALH